LRFADSITVDPAAGTSTAVFFVDSAADYLKDHFPGAPTLPGLVMLESAVRAAAALWDATDTGAAGRGAVLERVERLQIVRRVVPGELLTVNAVRDPDGADPGTVWFTARGTVEGGLAMRARFRLRR
jgi:3-hydroxymyristoyl/3-hydroxydecanoyl-(acyl carrier protein) dehydratase